MTRFTLISNLFLAQRVESRSDEQVSSEYTKWFMLIKTFQIITRGKLFIMLHNQSYQLGLIQSNFFTGTTCRRPVALLLDGCEICHLCNVLEPFTRYGTLAK